MKSLYEVVVIPLVMFFLLFWWRDRARIPHIPFADLVGLLVAADVICFVNVEHLVSLRIAAQLGSLEVSQPDFLLLAIGAAFGLLACFRLVQIEHELRPILDDYLVVGALPKNMNPKLVPEGWAGGNFRKFLNLWSLSLAVSAAFTAFELFLLGIRQTVVPVSSDWLDSLVMVGGTFGLFYLFGHLLTVIGRATTYYKFFRDPP